jgi:hypothetical protein
MVRPATIGAKIAPSRDRRHLIDGQLIASMASMSGANAVCDRSWPYADIFGIAMPSFLQGGIKAPWKTPMRVLDPALALGGQGGDV